MSLTTKDLNAYLADHSSARTLAETQCSLLEFNLTHPNFKIVVTSLEVGEQQPSQATFNPCQIKISGIAKYGPNLESQKVFVAYVIWMITEAADGIPLCITAWPDSCGAQLYSVDGKPVV